MNNLLSNKGVFACLLAGVFFGAYPAAAKGAYQEGANIALVVIATNMGRAAFLFLYALSRQFSPKEIIANSSVSIFSGFLQAISVFCIIASLQFIPAPITITIVFTNTIMLLFYHAYKGEEKLTRELLLITFVAFFGISLVVDVYDTLREINYIGIILAFIGAIATATRIYSFGKQVVSTPNSIVGTQVFIYASLFSLLVILWQVPILPSTSLGYGWMAVCIFSLGMGSILTFYALSLMGSFRFSLILMIEPVFTSIYAYFLINEILALRQYLGIVTVLVSLVLFKFYTRKQDKHLGISSNP